MPGKLVDVWRFCSFIQFPRFDFVGLLPGCFLVEIVDQVFCSLKSHCHLSKLYHISVFMCMYVIAVSDIFQQYLFDASLNGCSSAGYLMQQLFTGRAIPKI